MGKKPHKPGENPCKLSKSISIKSDVPLRFEFVLSELWKPNKTRSCGKEANKTRRIHADFSCTNVRMKSDVPLRLGFVSSKLWKLNKTRSCEKEAIQNQERIEFRMKSDVPLRFGFVLNELWKPNKTRSCGKEADLY